MCQLCVRSGFWGLWKQYQLSQVSESRCVGLVDGRIAGVDVRCFVPVLFSSSSSYLLWGSLSHLGVLLVFGGGAGVVLLRVHACWCRYCACVSCVMGFFVLCVIPTLLQIYYRVCGPRKCLGAQNVQGSPSIENYFCHSRWDSHLNTKAEFIYLSKKREHLSISALFCFCSESETVFLIGLAVCLQAHIRPVSSFLLKKH